MPDRDEARVALLGQNELEYEGDLTALLERRFDHRHLRSVVSALSYIARLESERGKDHLARYLGLTSDPAFETALRLYLNDAPGEVINEVLDDIYQTEDKNFARLHELLSEAFKQLRRKERDQGLLFEILKAKAGITGQ